MSPSPRSARLARAALPRAAARSRARGVTLIEVMIVLVLVAVMTGLGLGALGMAESARLRSSAAMIASAIRVAYGHANASSKVTRLVFNLEQRTVAIEEAQGQLWLAKNDRTGGAAAATEAERKAQEEAESIFQGPRAPRPSFRPVKVFGFGNSDKNIPAKELERGVRFLQIETGHQDDVAKTDQAYLYFWPGGQTERAGVQICVSTCTLDSDVLTLFVSPLTGKVDMRKGKVAMPRPRDDNEESERRDTGF
jgi:general secretion pathway protein H